MKICVINQKGGTGKTTTSIHLAAALAKRGSRALLIDCDPQGSVAVSLRLTPNGLAQIFSREFSLSDVLQNFSANFDVITGGPLLLKVESELHQNDNLKSKLFETHLDCEPYDYVILDMAPSRSLLNEAALYFCDEILVPVACDYLSLVGVRDVLEFVDRVGHDRGSKIQLRALVPTMYDTRSKISHESCTILERHFPSKVSDPIRQSTKAKEAPSFGKTLLEYAPSSTSARDYLKLANIFE